jgi:hypothetical protein
MCIRSKEPEHATYATIGRIWENICNANNLVWTTNYQYIWEMENNWLSDLRFKQRPHVSSLTKTKIFIVTNNWTNYGTQNSESASP